MRVMLVFFGLVLVSGVRAAKRGRVNRTWPVVALAVVITLAFLNQRSY